MNNILPKDGNVTYYENFFSEEESSLYFSALLSEINWKHEPIKLFGREVMQPRLTAWYGNPDISYSYSGIRMEPNLWTPSLILIKDKIEHFTKFTFTSALLNQYRDENDSVGWHRDNEKELGKNPVIASISFGGSRTFQFRHSKEKDLKLSLELENGSLLLMQGETQHCWHHALPKTKAPKEPRINITFRII